MDGARRFFRRQDLEADDRDRAEQRDSGPVELHERQPAEDHADVDDHEDRHDRDGHPGIAYAAERAGRLRKCSSASGFASASTFFTARPWTTSRTASSTIFPLLVRGMSAT